MGFLAPIYLLLGAGVAVPLLVHLLRRRAGARVDFPAVRYLARAEREHQRRLRVRNVLLMLLRAAIVALVALAAARPVARGLAHVLSSGHAPVAIAVVLDNSLSTSVIERGRPVLDILRDAVRRVVDRTGAGDRVWLVTADGRVRPVGSLATLEPLAGAGDLPRAVERAAGLVRSAGLPGRVVAVATDGQATAWPMIADVGDVTAAVFAPAGRPPPNHAVTSVTVRPSRWTPDGEIAATVLGAGDSTTYRITLAARTLARGTVASVAGGMGTLAIHASPPERGWVSGTVELEPDELRGDDVRHFALWIGDPTQVQVDSAAGPFVGGAVDALIAAGRAARGGGRGGGGAGGGGGGGRGGTTVSVVSADDLSTLPAVIIAPRDPVRLGAANRALERAGVPWRFRAANGLTGVRAAPLESRGGGPLAGVDAGQATQWYALEAQPGAVADTVVSVGGTAPWAVAGERYVLVASPLDPGATTLPVRAAFVPWFADLLTERLGAGGDGGARVLDASPGAALPRPAWVASLELPSGAAQPVSGASLTAPTETGVFFLRSADGARAGALVVNGEASESDLRRLSPSELGARLQGTRPGGPGGARAAVYDDAVRWADGVFDAAAGRPLAAPFLLAALALLAVEALVVRGGMRARRPAAA